MEENVSDLNKFNDYGIYKISDYSEFLFPNIELKIKRISDNVFSYIRKNHDDEIIEKIIPATSNEITIEIVPIRPLNYPARRTNYVYLDLDTPIFLSEGSAATIFVRCPIEIGVFLVYDAHKDSLDWFTCDPLNSRFGLYGTPESGTMCKYSKSEIVESYDDSISFVNAVIEINLKNGLDGGHSISKIVFPISEYSLYYKGSKAIIDSLDAILKKKLTLEILDISPKPLQTEWTMSPSYEPAEMIKRMDMGVD